MLVKTKSTLLLSTLTILLISIDNPASARILQCCEAAKELNIAKIPRTFHSSFVCLMKYESSFNTAKKTGPGYKASYAYGILQIRSDKYCNAFRPGGVCNKKCDDFLDDNIQDDIACANIIFQNEGLKYWNNISKCKDQNLLPNLSTCYNARSSFMDKLTGSPMPCR